MRGLPRGFAFAIHIFDRRQPRGFARTPRENETCDLFEFVGIEPGSVLMTLIDDHARTLSKVATPHLCIAFRAAPVFDLASRGIPALDTWRGRVTGGQFLAHELCCPIDERVEPIPWCPESVTFLAFLNLEATDDARCHTAITARASELGLLWLDRFGFEADSTSEAEPRIIRVARKTLWADQASAIADVDDGGTAVAAVLVLFLGQGPACATALNRRVGALQRHDPQLGTAATIELAVRRHFGDIVLRMTV